MSDEFFWCSHNGDEMVPIDPSRIARLPDGSYLVEPDSDDDDAYGPARPRRNLTTVELPAWPGDDALGQP
jgi:hypothetical protein